MPVQHTTYNTSDTNEFDHTLAVGRRDFLVVACGVRLRPPLPFLGPAPGFAWCPNTGADWGRLMCGDDSIGSESNSSSDGDSTTGDDSGWMEEGDR